MKRKFLSASEASQEVGGYHHLLELVDLHGLQAYVYATGKHASQNDGEPDFHNDTLGDGEHEASSWTARFKHGERDFVYLLKGFFKLPPRWYAELARSDKAPREVSVPSFRGGKEFGTFLFEATWNDVHFLASDIHSTRDSAHDKSERSEVLGERARTSLLRIIRALDKMADLPHRGPSSSIEEQLQKLGFMSPKEAVIRDVIKQARELELDGKPQ